MVDFINKVITIIMIFILLILTPMLLSYMRTEMIADRLVLNDVVLFINTVTDKGTINPNDITDLNARVNAHGGIYDVKVFKYSRDTGEQSPDDMKPVFYKDEVHKDSSTPLFMRDAVKVTIREVGYTNSKRLMYKLLGVDKGPLEFSLAGTVK